MLVDCDFQISSDIQNIGYDDDIKIINSQRILLIKCRTAHNCNEWAKHLSNLTQQAKDFASETRNRSDSYAPIRENQLAYYYLSFVHGVSTGRKEGYQQEESINYYFDYHALSRASYFCDICKCHDSPNWFVIKDTYIVDIRPDTHEICFPMLVDRNFQVSTGLQNIASNDSIKVSNSQRTLVINCRTARDCDEWTKNLLNLTEQAKDFVNETRSRFDSYVPVRENQLAYWFINGKSYMKAVAKALLTAKEEVFITDWWLSPELILIRPADNKTFRLDNILGRIADEGVRVYVMLYKEMPFALGLNSLYTERKSVSKNPKGFIKRARKSDEDPDDGKILEEQQSDNTSTSEVDKKYQYFIGKDYSNAYQRDFTELEDYTTDSVARTLVPRMPWHDEALVVFGQTARDVARHFIQRWNIHKSYNDVEDLAVENWSDFLESEPFRVNAQCVRSVGPWSAGTKSEESSIHNTYIQMIDAAKHFIYIENQFFITIAQDSVVRNQLANVLFRRIERAHNNAEKFRIYVVLPLLPGFDNTNAVRAVLYFIMCSITKGDNSLFKRLENAGISPKDYINFFGMRNHDILMGRLVTEIIYVHSKLMIIDDRMAICGSANINDRSLLGNRDSEFCIVINDLEEEDGIAPFIIWT
ncbi:unnamed protein product [Rotaria sp. Silwood1]|nr:unnamed protein product [Rotaria sp. Silwood1]